MLWIYSILLDVRITSSLGTNGGKNQGLTLLKAPPMYTLSGRSCPLNVISAIFAEYLQ